jgi:hypothetical protein
MADDGFEYEMALKDSMSGPAKAETEALKSLTGAVVRLRDEHGRFISAAKAAAAAASGTTAATAGMSAAMRSAEKAAKSLVPELALVAAATAGIRWLEEAVVGAVSGFADLSVDAVRFALESAEFKENASEAFAAVQGTAEEGRETYDIIEKIARTSHTPIEKAESMASQLQLQGLDNEKLLYQVVQSVSDLSRVGSGQGAEKLQSLIQRSLATGTFKPMGRQLLGLGVSMPELVAQLAKNLHEPVAQIKAEMKAGKIGVEDGIAAITTSIEGSKIAELAHKKFTLGDFGVDLKNTLTSLFEGVPIDPFLDRLHEMADIFGDTTTGVGGLKDAITGMFGQIVAWATPAVDAVTLFGLEAELGFLKAELAMGPALRSLEKVELSEPGMKALGTAIEFAAENMAKLAIEAVQAAAAVGRLLGLLAPGEGQLQESGVDIGLNWIDGILSFGTLTLAEAAGRAIGNSFHDGAKAGVDAHSPSRKAMQLGDDYAEGFSLGVDGSHERARGAIADATDMPDFSNVGRGAGGKTVDVGGIHVEVHGGGGADEMRTLADDILADALERVNLELGG